MSISKALNRYAKARAGAKMDVRESRWFCDRPKRTLRAEAKRTMRRAERRLASALIAEQMGG